MEFLKQITASLFGLSRSSKPKAKKSAALKKKAATKKKKPAKLSKPRKSIKTAKKKSQKPKKKVTVSKLKRPPKPKRKTKQPVLVKEALSLLPLGEVTHYFPHVQAAVVKIEQGDIREGQMLSFRGHTTNFKQSAVSMQMDHRPIQIAKAGDEIGIRVKSRVRVGDKVFKV